MKIKNKHIKALIFLKCAHLNFKAVMKVFSLYLNILNQVCVFISGLQLQIEDTTGSWMIFLSIK